MLNILNTKLFFLINRGAGQFVFLDSFFVFVSKFFVPIIVGLVIVWFFLVLPKKSKDPLKKLSAYKNAGLLTLSLLIVWPLVELIKGLVAFPRPARLLQDVHLLSLQVGYDSFPSLHTAIAFTVATFVFYYSKKTGILLFLLAGLVGLSRVFVGAHFPLDVLVGALIGFLIPKIIHRVFKN